MGFFKKLKRGFKKLVKGVKKVVKSKTFKVLAGVAAIAVGAAFVFPAIKAAAPKWIGAAIKGGKTAFTASKNFLFGTGAPTGATNAAGAALKHRGVIGGAARYLVNNPGVATSLGQGMGNALQAYSGMQQQEDIARQQEQNTQGLADWASAVSGNVGSGWGSPNPTPMPIPPQPSNQFDIQGHFSQLRDRNKRTLGGALDAWNNRSMGTT